MTTLFRRLFVIALIGVTVLAVVPEEAAVVTSGWDKANHFIAFFVLLALLDRAYPAGRFVVFKIAALLGYGILLEIVQSLVAGRDASLLDVGADMVGLAAYALVRPAVLSVLDRLQAGAKE